MIGDDKVLVCLECGEIFSNPTIWTEDRGECFGAPAYEELSGSPCCHGAFAEAFRCDCCGEWITTEEYIRTKDGERFCEECFTLVKLGDE